MAISAQEVAKELISYTVVTDKDSLVKLLERNGIQMPNNPSDREVTVAVLAASGKSQNFKNELAKLLGSKVPQAAEDYSNFAGDSSDFGFTGIDDFSFTGGEEFFNSNGIQTALASRTQPLNLTPAAKAPSKSEQRKASRVTAENPQGKTAVGLFLQNLGKSLTSQDTINQGVNIGLTSLNNKVQGRSNSLAQETTALTQRQDEIRQQMAASPKKGIGTIGVIGIVLGVVALGATIYFVAKKKK
jgi:ElaB/YqjD/DUF883 family membrane-anchored ribosome-binding protein